MSLFEAQFCNYDKINYGEKNTFYDMEKKTQNTLF